ncbi:MAG: sugar ABC transporter substrate-binding protein [Verrucomicrobia bacterium]|nr:sugar ABC transporter substrate-binding protein [Verrucomicrobiota bacterium]
MRLRCSHLLPVLLTGVFCQFNGGPVYGAETLKFWTFDYPPQELKLYQDYITEWNKTHDLKVEFQQFPFAQYYDQLTTSLATGEMPDVFLMSPSDWRRYAEGGLALPLEQYVPDYLKQDLLPASVQAVTYQGHILSLPFEMEPVVLWYNKTLLQENNLAVPTSWPELVEVAKKLTSKNRFGILLPTVPGGYQNFIFYPFLWMAGGDVMNAEQTKSVINTPEAARAFDLWGTLIRSGYAPATSSGGDPVDDRFPNRRGAMFVSGYWVWGNLKSNYPNFLKDLGVAPIPAPEKGGKLFTVYGGWTVMVYNRTRHPKEAADFAVNLFGAKDITRNLLWSTKYATKLSPRRSVLAESADFYKEFPHDVFATAIFPTARAELALPPEVAKALQESLQDVMFNNLSGKDAAAECARKIDDYLASRPR